MCGLQLERGAKIFCHFLSGDAYKTGFKLEAYTWHKSDVYLFLGLSIDDALMVVELEAGVHDFLHFCSILICIFITCCLLHLELDVEVAFRLICNGHRKSLGITYCNGAKV